MEYLNSLFSEWSKTFQNQGTIGKVIIALLLIITFCCLCSLPIRLFSRAPSTATTPFPTIQSNFGTAATPTGLFNFAYTPTIYSPTATLTSLPTQTATVTPTIFLTLTNPSTASLTSVPTATATVANSAGSINILSVNKSEEYVDIQNISNTLLNLEGWTLVSERGQQSCELRGTLPANEILRVWAGRGRPGFSCRYLVNIWNDTEPDPAVLYDPQGQEMDRYP